MKQLLLALFTWPLAACGALYRAESIEGWIVDPRSGPLEGVVVVAHWEVNGGFMDQRPVGELRIVETVTDKNGRYFFPAWGPVLVTNGELGSNSPGILMFKRGYKAATLGNLFYETEGTSKFHHNKAVTPLDRFEGPPRDYAEQLAALNSSLQKVGYGIGRESGDYCGWKQFPRMLRALDDLDATFQSANVSRGVVGFLKTNDARLKERGCGSVFDMLMESRK